MGGPHTHTQKSRQLCEHNLTFVAGLFFWANKKVQLIVWFFVIIQNDQSFMTFEGQQLQGAVKIMEKLQVSSTTIN